MVALIFLVWAGLCALLLLWNKGAHSLPTPPIEPDEEQETWI